MTSAMENLTPQEQAVLVRVLQSRELQNLIGAEEWGLTDAEETTLWEIINRLPKES